MPEDLTRASALRVWIKHGALLLLTLVTSALVLLTKSSRAVPESKCLTTNIAVTSIALKFITSICVYSYHSSRKSHEQLKSLEHNESGKVPSILSQGWMLMEDLFGAKSDFLFLLIPAALYTTTKDLELIAASHLDVATYQITYQAELITTAFFSVMTMRQKLSALKWLSILVLATGTSLISLPDNKVRSMYASNIALSYIERTPHTVETLDPRISLAVDEEKLTGLLAIFGSCIFSGLANVLFESALKRHPRRPSTTAANNADTASFGGAFHQNLWSRNARMSFGTLVFSAIDAAIWHAQSLRRNEFFSGFNSLVWAIVIVQTLTGVVVAVVIATSDNILKGFANSFSVVLSSIISCLLHDSRPSKNFIFGSILIFVASHMYSLPDTSCRDTAIDEKCRPYESGPENQFVADVKSRPAI